MGNLCSSSHIQWNISSNVGIRDVKTGFLANRFSVLLAFIKIRYYTRQIILCITHCNVHTRKAVSTLIFSFSRCRSYEYSLFCVFYRKTLLIKTR